MQNYYHLSRKVLETANVIYQEQPLRSTVTSQVISRPVAVLYRKSDNKVARAYSLSALKDFVNCIPSIFENGYVEIYAML